MLTWRALILTGLLGALACERGPREGQAASSSDESAASLSAAEQEAAARAAEEQARIDAEYPSHALVTGVQLPVRAAPEPNATVIGWLRLGARVRVKTEGTPSPRCATGWHAVNPTGYACAGQGLEIGSEPPEADASAVAADREAPLPYEYLKVKEDLVPEYHNPPTRDEHTEVMAWAARYLALRARSPEQAERMRSATRGTDAPPARVARFLDRGVIVAMAGIVRREERRYARTVTGRYILRVQLHRKDGSTFHGVEVNAERPLPIPWARQDIRPRERLPDLRDEDRRSGDWRFFRDAEAEIIPAGTIVGSWQRREWFDGNVMHVLDGDRFARAWYIGVAELAEPPFEVAADEPWVHVDLGEQTLTLYRGSDPVYSTLVSSGDPAHPTPRGIFRIQRKMITSTMSNLGGDVDSDRYRIEDVPYTQYFEQGIALHAAFWHERFGQLVSHGCVNLSPVDAQRVFEFTWPEIPAGWHGVVTHQTAFRSSRVWVTD
ncbi:MAG: L,D-transpeptidase [Sandaracinaceae bacterium]|nr:L,D-transpeptidase [Sandaracinaceae bacterium]